MNETHLRKTGANLGKEFFGVQTVSGDTERSSGWDLLTHGGFLTYGHHDAGGLCTHASVRSGTKIWAYMSTTDATIKSLDELFKTWDTLFEASVEMQLPPNLQMGTIVLRKGGTL